MLHIFTNITRCMSGSNSSSILSNGNLFLLIVHWLLRSCIYGIVQNPYFSACSYLTKIFVLNFLTGGCIAEKFISYHKQCETTDNELNICNICDQNKYYTGLDSLLMFSRWTMTFNFCIDTFYWKICKKKKFTTEHAHAFTLLLFYSTA